jgi:hypothetical protein
MAMAKAELMPPFVMHIGQKKEISAMAEEIPTAQLLLC